LNGHNCRYNRTVEIRGTVGHTPICLVYPQFILHLLNERRQVKCNNGRKKPLYSSCLVPIYAYYNTLLKPAIYLEKNPPFFLV